MPTNLTVILRDRPGELARLGEVTGAAGVNIRGLAAFTGEGRGVIHVLVDDDAVARARAELKRAGMGLADEREVLVVDVQDRPGSLGELARELDTLDLYGAALAHWNFARRRVPRTPGVRVYNPSFEQDGWQSPHTAIEIVTDDMPFLVDSVSMELSRQESGIHVNIHPVLRVRRSAGGELEEVVAPDAAPQDGELVESLIHIEVDRQSEASEHKALAQALLHVLGQVRATVEDWPEMRARVGELIAELEQPPPGLVSADVEE